MVKKLESKVIANPQDDLLPTQHQSLEYELH
jgi:hypothetical protein